MTKFPGWRTMTAAQRRNAKYDAIWEGAKNEKTRFTAQGRSSHPDTASLYCEFFPDTGHRYWRNYVSGAVWFGQKPEGDRWQEIDEATYRRCFPENAR